jgi:hypothetical protein
MLLPSQVNLVATQLVLDREHPNRIVFSPNRGLDPLLDLRLRGAQVGHSLCDPLCACLLCGLHAPVASHPKDEPFLLRWLMHRCRRLSRGEPLPGSRTWFLRPRRLALESR